MSTNEELKNVTGLFVIVGSLDFPFNYSYNQPFGFDPDNDIPIFKYSLNQCIDGFENGQSLSIPSVINKDTISLLIAECANNAGLNSQDLSSEDWKGVFQILEWVAANKTTILSVKNWPEMGTTYPNFPDYVFRNVSLDEKFNADLVNYVKNYVAKSFYFVESSKKDRISLIEFKVKINEIPKLFKIYFDADDFMSAYAGAKFFVYYYKDLDDNNEISQEEFDKQIIDKVNSGIMKETYITCKQYFTPYCKPVYQEGIIASHEPAVNRTFWVYSNLPDSELTEEIIVDQIRQELIKDNGGTEDDLSNQYPNLFVDQEVHIYPIHDNTAINKAEDNSLQIVHPVSYAKIQEVMKSFGLSLITTADGFRNIEIFYVGIDSVEKNTLNKFIYPLLAADFSVDKTKLPISSRFINYSPRSFADWDGTGADDDKFQFILINCLGYFEKHFNKEALLTNIQTIKDNLDFKVIDAEEGDNSKITFKMKNTKFTVTWYYSVS